MEKVRAKFACVAKEATLSGGEELTTVKLSPVYGDSPENKEFFRYTPSGRVELGTINKAAADGFELGKAYYVDFTPAEA